MTMCTYPLDYQYIDTLRGYVRRFDLYCDLFFFFFSSRRRHTRYWRDWSSDVCSSDLDFDRMPNLFVIGAAKAGTTALYDYLTQHPRVFLSQVKETMFFSREEYYARGLDWYEGAYFEGEIGRASCRERV